MLKNYFKIAWRNLTKYKGYTIINVLGLAIGISACLIVYLITSFELGYDTFYPDKDRIYRVVSDDFDNTYGKRYSSGTPYNVTLAIRNEFTGIEEVGTFYDYSTKVKVPTRMGTKKFDIPESKEIIITEAQYFNIFKYEWLAGTASAALDRPFTVVLAESKARQYFGSMPIQDIIGKEVIYDDSLHLTVSGVVKDPGKNTDLAFKDFISFGTIQSSFLRNPLGHPWPGQGQTFLKLAKGGTPRQFELQTGPVIQRLLTEWKASADYQHHIYLQPLADLHFNADYRDFYTRQAHLPTLYALMGIAAFMLIIAAINFINLSTAQSFQRAKEIGIRKVLGSSRASLVLQFLSETWILTCIAVILSMAMVNPILNSFRDLIPTGVTFKAASPFTLIFVLLVTIITALLAGFYPAKVLSSYLPALSLKGQGTNGSNHKSYLPKVLIVFQFTVSLLFIISAIVVSNQVHYMLNKDLGFKKDAIITINVKGNYAGGTKLLLQERISQLAERIRQLPGIENASLSNQSPEVTYTNAGWLYCRDKGIEISGCEERVADEHYIPLYGFRLIAGRNFIDQRGDDSITEFLINETCAKQLGFKKPGEAIGHMVQPGFVDKTGFHPWWGGIAGQVVGVLADFHTRPMYSAVAPTYLLPLQSCPA
jgi:putative ABC transport system permease protein